MRDDIQPTDWFSGLDFATDVYSGVGTDIRSTRQAGASPEADLLDRQTVPADPATYHRRLLEVFGEREEQVAARLASNVQLQALLKAWKPGPGRYPRQQAETIFKLLSDAMGEVFGFRPAPLSWSPGLPADNAIGLFLRGAGWEKVILSIRLLDAPSRTFVETALHEQVHRLQHALTTQLNDPTRPLDPFERGLVLYWLRQEPERQKGYAAAARQSNPAVAKERYRALAVEYHAYSTSERIAGSF